MTILKESGQPGNTLPIATSYTDTLLIDYALGFRRPVVAIGTTSYTVTSSQTGTFFTYGGIGSACSVVLPAPEPGLWFEFAATGAIVSSNTKFTCATTDAFIHCGRTGTSAGVGTIAAGATSQEFAAAGLYLEFVGLTTARYLVKQWAGGASVASTAAMEGASGA
jgi:hypothetical protein